MIIREVLGCDTQVCKGFSRVLEVGINSIKPVSCLPAGTAVLDP